MPFLSFLGEYLSQTGMQSQQIVGMMRSRMKEKSGGEGGGATNNKSGVKKEKQRALMQNRLP